MIVTQGVCSDTSECYTLDYTGLDKNGMPQGFEVYPNPTHNYLTIQMAIENTNAKIKVVNMMGQVVLIEQMDKLVRTNLDLSRYMPGVYLINIYSDQLNSIIRVVKE